MADSFNQAPLSNYLGDKSLTGAGEVRKKRGKVFNTRGNTLEKRRMLLTGSQHKSPQLNNRTKQSNYESADKSPLGVQ